ncbi:MAG: glucose-6-phosphate isomerase, partial [Leucobacter sp.]|nr:glucose-6-phosphate isomerase [Leucobacter sp.]
MPQVQVELGPGVSPGRAELRALVDAGFASRLFARDVTLWGDSAGPSPEQRLGWVDAFDRGADLVAEVEELRTELVASGIDRVVLCGMGGSSLAAEVICQRDWAPLHVLGSSHPAEVRRALSELPRTVAVVSSKSGSTAETMSQLLTFEVAFGEAGIDARSRIVVVTDPETVLHELARERGYRVFLGDPTVGGRYSALTAFGLVPAVLAGADASSVRAEAATMGAPLSVDSVENPALRLAAAFAAALPGRYLCGLHESQVRGTPLAAWIEQLIAESTGKDGTGILPIALPPWAPEIASSLPANELLVELRPSPGIGEVPADALAVSGPLGGQFLVWEVATAALSWLLGVNPFDQPDVEASKTAARAAFEQSETPCDGGTGLLDAGGVSALSSALPAGGYLAIQAFVDSATTAPLGELRAALVGALGVPVALGFGPRYLHSTGQFHKGGPATGVFLQVNDSPETLEAADLPILGTDAGYAALIAAQARGDREVLEARGRTVFTLRV